MLELKNSDIFANHINKNNSIFGRVNTILSGAEPSTVFLNEILFPDIKRKIIDRRKEVTVTKMGNAIVEGRMVLFAVSPEKNLPDLVPFFVYKQYGSRKVAVNLTNVIVRTKDDSGNIVYDLGENVNKVYSMIYSAYLALDVFTERTVLTQDALYYSAVLWSDMFVKPLNDAYGLSINIDRYKAFMYFSIKFFLGYYMEAPESQINSLAVKYVGEKNQLIMYMEDQINHRGINIYEGLIPFCHMLFNNEITGIKGVRVNNVSNSMNMSFYLERFTQSFHRNALLSLCAYPYFIYVLIAASTKCNMVKDKAFDRIFKDEGTMLAKLMTAMLK